ncbi:lipoyl(octanoyl) transferase [Cricetibacter osteomyelitidis]|uniref:Octanoyltransferase n=1 Tax=Cricetibacter osteomyelitidis TaxID=1521931 RepID=A0A4R2SPU7_9PAST|nr:lipoyl(octanoyl) transferase LipB [Cricetibacter osteomyelitidis]TCP92189.1 lipoyl(octanoyl) transferase [Cricetibacter osteomyelitidis]
MNSSMLIVRQLGMRPYEEIWHKMQAFTDTRDEQTLDEIWLVEHPPVFTQGQAGKAEHLLYQSNIPVVQSDRGGQITYHGPGQQVMYVLIDIRRQKALNSEFNVRHLVTALEQTVVQALVDFGINSYPKPDAPGVYVDGQKICSLGLCVRKGCSFHGLALNINMDLSPFQQINPCGYAGLQMTQMAMLLNRPDLKLAEIAPHLVTHFAQILNYQAVQEIDGLA